jgi:outer membrane protein assembly factor BamB
VVRIDGIVGDTLYVVTGRRTITARAATDGTEQWSIDLYAHLFDAVHSQYLNENPRGIAATLCPTPDTVYVATSYGLHGLAADDGTERWRAYVPTDAGDSDPHHSAPEGFAVASDSVVAGYRHNTASVVEYRDGAVHAANAPLGTLSLLMSAPTVSGDTLCLTANLGTGSHLSPIATGYEQGASRLF